ncbi:septum formation inhibitor Maf [Marinicauda salina]|uniref:Nucleoside triphosphate pyrophosphatase n=1 Tax=Marinicauda salina TaxID=2135793 RepID=A0A2U2BWI4_9PROT|nr:nucleoside triphosphate pyrophosphatase [Marinicauda salina]PWE18362.1 septum formation inhibitor Maf [Marinicauda salina]
MSFILASGSASRRAILENAGLDFEIDPADVDEDALKTGYSGDIGALAVRLGEEKALAVSRRREGLVLGADQVLEFEGRLFDKARSAEEAEARLRELRGRTHWLKGGVAAAVGGEIVWRHESACRMVMRDFSDAFLADYVARAGDMLTSSVGGYAYEGLGAQLFSEVEGDYFAVLGLPLLPVLGMLRDHGAAPA